VIHLYRQLGIPAEDRGLAYVYPSPIGVIMPGCEPVQPGLVVIRTERRDILRERRIYGVPDLIIEVLSPGSVSYDEEVKLAAYAEAGVPEYAVVDPATRSLRLYALAAPGRYAQPREFGSAQTVTFACLPSIPLEIGRLFEGAPDTTL
jgi:Uma2 family endonuclease